MIALSPARAARVLLASILLLVGAACRSDGASGRADPSTADVEAVGDVAPTEDAFFGPMVRFADRLLLERQAVDAFATLILALDRGYSMEQIGAGVDQLAPLGEIAGTEPSGQSLGMTDVVAARPQGFASRMIRTSRSRPAGVSQPEPALAFVFEFERTLGAVWERAQLKSALEIFVPDPDPAPAPTYVSGATDDDVLKIAMIAALASRGYGPDQIVEALVLGTVGSFPAGTRCIVITDTLPRAPLPDEFPCPRVRIVDDDDPDGAASVEDEVVDSGTGDEVSGQTDGSADAIYRAPFPDRAAAGTVVEAAVVERTELVLRIEDGIGSIDGAYVVTGTCPDGSTLTWTDSLFSESFPVPDDLSEALAVTMTYRIDIDGRCPSTVASDQQIGPDLIEEFDGSEASGQAELVFGGDSVTIVAEGGPLVLIRD